MAWLLYLIFSKPRHSPCYSTLKGHPTIQVWNHIFLTFLLFYFVYVCKPACGSRSKGSLEGRKARRGLLTRPSSWIGSCSNVLEEGEEAGRAQALHPSRRWFPPPRLPSDPGGNCQPASMTRFESFALFCFFKFILLLFSFALAAFLSAAFPRQLIICESHRTNSPNTVWVPEMALNQGDKPGSKHLYLLGPSPLPLEPSF